MPNNYIIGSGVLEETANAAGPLLGDGLLTNTDPQLQLTPKNSGVIDVVNNFNWYSGPKAPPQVLNSVPKALIVERKQLLNSLIASALYYVSASINSTDQAAATLIKKSEGIQSLLKSINKTVNISNAIDKIEGFKSALSNDSDRALLTSNNLKSLIGIYFTRPTGFKYSLPYFNNPINVNNSWSTSSGGSTGISSIIGTGMDIVEEISSTVNITQPGVFIQKPKYFQFDDSGKSVTISFPLFNTIKRFENIVPYQQNYELLWLLAFQNKPYKTSFARTPPSSIYSITIPGICNFPYAYISDMSVDFVGTVRNKSVTVPQLKGKDVSFSSIVAPIPEAYNVTITFTSLMNDFANLMVGSGFSAKIEKNTVTF